MKIRFGYVAIALNIHEGSPNKTITYKSFSQLPDDETKLYKLKSLTKQNLETTKRILIYNKAHNIMLYRFTSKLVPLVTHPDVLKWDYTSEFEDLYKSIGEFVLKNNLRVSAHPDHFTLINTPNDKVLSASLEDLEYHTKIFEAMGLTEKHAKLVLHVGGTYKNKKESMERFINNFNHIDVRYRNRIILENDDKSFTAKEVLEICQQLSIPMVLDIHHHWCNHHGENIIELLPSIFDTWKNEIVPPKIHASSPKDKKNIRAHADYLDLPFLMDFICNAKQYDRDFDIMIEAKKKDLALLKLMEDLKEEHHRSSINLLDEASIELN
ncbi:UV DNA damage endonuclease UvsE [Clostridium aceticum]|uniref:UV DNA damage endonuclease UvsE n=1 Tax=Clostridium aceticum TaxID=84022 RepID=A0A0D8IDJ9_9CLOT|nr:UV DNA damage repair endonuclease UvsE [Clostridium aceticum]AKL95341.1 UV DNA damage endonuclease UvsE [Clostridium aceticum]KJF28179.1 UV damage repair endonuclease UvdE [Clostridium aceticum]